MARSGPRSFRVCTLALFASGALAGPLVLGACSEESLRGRDVDDATPGTATAPVVKSADASRAVPAAGNFDRRAVGARGRRAPAAAQLDAIAALKARVGDLTVRLDPSTGVTRSLSAPAGYLTGPEPSRSPLEVALDFVRGNAALLGLAPADLELEVTDVVYSAPTGATHVYLRQLLRGVPVYDGQLQVHVNRDGRILGVSNAFFPGLAGAVRDLTPRQSAAAAVASASAHAGLALARLPRELSPALGARRATAVEHAGVSREPIEARLALLPVAAGDVRLVWQLALHTLDGKHAYDVTVDAIDGLVWTRVDWVANAQYRVYPLPVESPNHTTPLPPADGRVLVTDPADLLASPYGWHDTDGADGAELTGLAGNNVHAYEDADDNDAPPGTEPSCGDGLVCDFPLDLTRPPQEYAPAAVTNLFYWTNLVHDVQYRYGFDEQAGNFQVNGYGRGGVEGDPLDAEAQDGSGLDNANFMTPPDGYSPRMQMFLWDTSIPERDGDLDAGIVVHELGHGISNRQVGGPSNVDCLWNEQQPGEGWSDWLSLVYTARAEDAGTDGRGMGTYALGQPTSGSGIREERYSTDPAINDWTYESIQAAMVPHGVGSVWAQALWEVYWKLVEAHGFSADLRDPSGGAGNQRAMLYVNEGMKLTACDPSFLDARDAIVQAAVDNWGGEDVCRIWEAFAAFGLGADAYTDGSNSSATNGFELPLACQCQPPAVADAGPDATLCLGGSVTLGGAAQPENSYLWSPGGETTAQITVAPTVTTTYSVSATTTCGTRSDSATVVVDDGTLPIGLSEDFELPASAWTMTGLWHQVTDSPCASPGYSSPSTAMYYGLDDTCTYDTGGTTTGDLVSPVIYGVTAGSALRFDYFRVAEPYYDRTEVSVSTNGGKSWRKVWSADTEGVVDGRWASSGFIPLGAFAGQPLQVRFRFYGDYSVSWFLGWLVDDVVVTGLSPCHTGNTAPLLELRGPRDGPVVRPVELDAGAWDMEDGDLTNQIEWTSSVDGVLGYGGSVLAWPSLGAHVITATVTDAAGVVASRSVTVTVADDTEPPVVWLTSPSEGSWWMNWLYVQAGATDDGAVERVDFYVDDAFVGSDAQAPYEGWLDLGMTSPGAHVATAQAIDRAGNVGVSVPVTFFVQTASAPPVVSIVSPLPGDTVSGLVDVTIAATDPDGTITQVALVVDDLMMGWITSEPYVITWDSSGFRGHHALRGMACDDSGQCSFSEDVIVNVLGDRSPPQVRFLQPTDGATLSGNVAIEAEASDDVGLNYVVIDTGSPLGTYWFFEPPYAVLWPSDEADNGPLTMILQAYDASWNLNTVAVHVTIDNPGHAAYDADFGAPACHETGSRCVAARLLRGRAMLGPEPNEPNTIYGSCPDGTAGTYLNEESIESIRVYTLDGSPMEPGKPVSVEVMASVWNTIDDYVDVYRAADATSPTWELVASLQGAYWGIQPLTTSYVLPEGDVQAVRAQVRYLSPETPCAEGPFNDHDDLVFTVVRDSTPPSVAVTAPAEGALVAGATPVSVSATDEKGVVWVEAFVDGVPLGTVDAAPYELEWDTLAASDGEHTLVARAADRAGNVAASPVVTVTVDNTAPVAAITSPWPDARLHKLVSVTAVAFDAQGLARVEFLVGDTVFATDESAPYEASLDTGSLPDGEYDLRARAVDVAGNAGLSAVVHVVVRN